ncbi:MAG: thiamine diphosphokinase [Chloroflexota bacterium]
MVALILADGDVPARARLDMAWPGWDAGVDLVIAADGGARHAARLGVTLDLWVGDGDSLGDEGIADLAAGGVPIERSPAEKDQTDLELAVDAALARGAGGLVIVGALGGERVDHALANVGLLARADLAGRPVVLLDGTARLSLVRAPDRAGGPVRAILAGEPGTTVSLLPVGGDVTGVTTDGLVYPLDDEPLLLGSARGVSNVVARSGASVTVRHGFLLVVGSPATL